MHRRSRPLSLWLAALVSVACVETRAADRQSLASQPLAVGQRQLFLDDFILGDVYRVKRVIHQPVKYKDNPVIRPDRPTDGRTIELRTAPSWDEREGVWKLWYFGTDDGQEGSGGSGYARSMDGVHWEKPNLGLVESHGNRNNNIVLVNGEPKAFTQHVFLDSSAPPESRYKAIIGPHDRRPAISSDGLVFTPLDVPMIPSQDESHIFFDDLQKQYVLTGKHNGPFGRSVFLSLSKDYREWSDPVLIYYADFFDQQLGEKYIREVEANPRMWRPPVDKPKEYNTEICNMPVFLYEGLYIGLPTYFESSGRIPMPRGNQDGTNSVKLACSRDLRAWTRVGDRSHFIPLSEMSEGVLDTGQILAGSRPIRMGDELWFYYAGVDVRYRANMPTVGEEFRGGIHLAKLRLDGFVSMHGGDEEGFVDTRPVRFDASRLFINATARGRIRAEVAERTGRTTLPGWGLDDWVEVKGDHLEAELRWKNRDLRELKGQNV